MNIPFRHTSSRRLLGAALVTAAVALAGCGGSPASSSTATSSSPASAAPTQSAPAASSSSPTGIPQGPTAGDRDADNNGGPSDGDGNV